MNEYFIFLSCFRSVNKMYINFQVTEYGAELSRWKGIIFGQKAESRSGFFDPTAVRLINSKCKFIFLFISYFQSKQ